MIRPNHFDRYLLPSERLFGAAKTIYAVTDRRIFIERSGPWAKFTVLALEHLSMMSLADFSGTRGSIQFGQATIFSREARYWGTWMPSLGPAAKFLAIDDVQRVFRLIQAQSLTGPK